MLLGIVLLDALPLAQHFIKLHRPCRLGLRLLIRIIHTHDALLMINVLVIIFHAAVLVVHGSLCGVAQLLYVGVRLDRARIVSRYKYFFDSSCVRLRQLF